MISRLNPADASIEAKMCRRSCIRAPATLAALQDSSPIVFDLDPVPVKATGEDINGVFLCVGSEVFENLTGRIRKRSAMKGLLLRGRARLRPPCRLLSDVDCLHRKRWDIGGSPCPLLSYL